MTLARTWKAHSIELLKGQNWMWGSHTFKICIELDPVHYWAYLDLIYICFSVLLCFVCPSVFFLIVLCFLVQAVRRTPLRWKTWQIRQVTKWNVTMCMACTSHLLCVCFCFFFVHCLFFWCFCLIYDFFADFDLVFLFFHAPSIWYPVGWK